MPKRCRVLLLSKYLAGNSELHMLVRSCSPITRKQFHAIRACWMLTGTWNLESLELLNNVPRP